MQISKIKNQIYKSKIKNFPPLFSILVLLFTFSFFIFTFRSALALSEDCSKSSIPFNLLDRCIQEIGNEVGALKPAHERNQQELADLKKQLTTLQSQINNLNRRITALGEDINSREEDVALQEILLEERVRSFYIKSRQFSPFLAFLFSANATELTRTLALQGQEATEDKRIIEDLSSQIAQLKSDRENLKKNKEGLGRVQAEVDKKAEFLSGEVAKVETYISTLTSKQSQLLAQKAGGFETSVGETPPTLEPCSGPPGSSNYCDPGFSGFAAFSFGAPHRKGMSQFGAKGRAEAGQSTEDILRAYYGNIKIETRGDLPSFINTTVGTFPFEDQYLMGIAEMPSAWNINALKAQAVAARTYALSYVGWRNSNPNGGTGRICTTEACQVYSSSKASNTPDSWKQAVRETRGQILLSNNTNEIISAWYASTAGGYIFSYTTLGHSTPGGWDAQGERGGWPDNAWDKKGGSPWFYKGWYRTRSGATCGKSHPWLTSEEMADILNAWQVLFRGGGDASRISPTDTGCWPGNPYSRDDLVAIGGYTSVSSASVVYGDNGTTLEVTFSTNKGSVSIPGEEFKKAFNLRAPGYIGIKSTLFNIVKTN
ncbi:MAG: SpoIID/LytB domain-containing protein [Candidatus Blackburnbacteria bacterium]|nr:SpoIID/LytB domain-containing protein [Candidatus Blackburnbacteria bacterium]